MVAVGGAIFLIPSAHATFPGHNGRIAFEDFTTGQIYTINPDGSDLRQLTHVASGVSAWGPSWSPNGKKIVFNNNVSGAVRTWVMNADGSNPHRLHPDRPHYNDFFPRFTPNGKRIFFLRCAPDVGCAIYSIRVDGSGRRAITHFKHDVIDSYFGLSPDGKRLAFTRFSARGVIAQIYMKRLDGGKAHALTPPALEAFWPDWSPSGKNFIFSTAANRFHARILRWRRDDGKIVEVTDPPFPHNDQETSYSPNGQTIAFQSDRGNDLLAWDLYTVRSDGTHLTRITTGMPGVSEVAWGPAASSVAGAGGGTPISALPTTSPRAAAAALARLCAMQPKYVRFPECKTAGK
jgi:Tol biopolymer transport system component